LLTDDVLAGTTIPAPAAASGNVDLFGGDINIVAVDGTDGLVFGGQLLRSADNYQFVQVQFAWTCS
jgi:hypothetical protein